jgi:hypothetical protein
MEKVKNFGSSLMAIGLVVIVVLVLNKTHSYFDKWLPLPATALLLVAFVFSLIIFFRALRGKSTLFMHIIVLIVVGLGGYFVGVKWEWSDIGGILAGVGAWVPAIVVDMLLKAVRRSVLYDSSDDGADYRKEEVSMTLDLDNPDPDKKRAFFNLADLFEIAEGDADTKAQKVLSDSLASITGFLREVRHLFSAGLINSKEAANARINVGLDPIFKDPRSTQTTSRESKGNGFPVMEDLDDNPYG